MFCAATQNGVGVGVSNIPALSSLPYATQLYLGVLGLFSSGANGVFLDANDWANVCFQDAAGTTPVTAMEQPIGLIRDKSGRGNDAKQTVSANRPTISARYNLLTKTEQFDNAVWTKTASTVSANAVTAPDGTLTADLLTETATTNGHIASQGSLSFTSGVSYTFSAYGKPNGRYLQFVFDGTAFPADYANFNLSNGTVAFTSSGNVVATITPAANGFYLCTAKITATGSNAAGVFYLCLQSTSNAGRAASYTGDGASGVYLWGADLRPSDQATGLIPTYQRVNTATDYDTVGFPPLIKGNGSNQFLQTASIDFTGTNKMTVWSGVRKVGDAAAAVLAELSVSPPSNNGTFGLLAPSSGSKNYVYRSNGTSDNAPNSGDLYPAPITNVVTGTSDIAAPSLVLRVNKNQVVNSSVTQGTGNYGNYAMYLLSRAGSSLYFSGGFNSLIVLGAAATAAQISMTEAWANQKLRAYA